MPADTPATASHGSSLPGHLTIGPWTRALSIVSIAAAFGLLARLAWRIAVESESFPWYAWAAIPAGMALADFLSGMVHWSADTWGSESMPILGSRLLHPFRVHHLNPADFLRRRFIDTNGDVALLAVPVLLATECIPLSDAASVAGAVFAAGFTGVGLMTNQIHQWAHMPRPPRIIGWLQRSGLILSHTAHERHHRPPYVRNYCIATGWCNRPLTAIGFFPALERAITGLTGIPPRRDDELFHAVHGAPGSSVEASPNHASVTP